MTKPCWTQLQLLEFSGPDLAHLTAETQRLSTSVLAFHTLRAYDEGWRHYLAWCKEMGKNPVPASGETIALYVTSMIDSGYSTETARIRVSGVAYGLRRDGHPPVEMSIAQRVLRGARRERSSVGRGKTAITIQQLKDFFESVDPCSLVAVRDRALILLGFTGGCRRSEIRALTLSDVTFVTEGVRVLLRRSKTDQQANGREIGLFAGRTKIICPVRALKAWIGKRGSSDGALFPPTLNGEILPGHLCGDSINEIVKRALKRIGADPAKYGSHSLRAGFVTAAVEAGASELAIMQRTGHKSVQMVHRYVRPASVFSVNPLRNVL